MANIGPAVCFGYDTQASPTLFRHYAAVREHLGVKPYYGTDAGTIATRAAHTVRSSRQTDYNRIKRHARRPSRQHLDMLIDQITWLDEIGDFTIALAGVPASKLRSLAMQAMSLDASALRKDTLPEGQAKNEAQLFSLFGSANIVIARRRLLAIEARGAS